MNEEPINILKYLNKKQIKPNTILINNLSIRRFFIELEKWRNVLVDKSISIPRFYLFDKDFSESNTFIGPIRDKPFGYARTHVAVSNFITFVLDFLLSSNNVTRFNRCCWGDIFFIISAAFWRWIWFLIKIPYYFHINRVSNILD